ncbi:MAG: threonine ammonia-lyase [Acidobacteria bacterium]|nr:MAG: threonine ammonia-lyase [Acidobacteriota bacterium]
MSVELDLDGLRAVHAASRELVRETPAMTSRSLSREIGGEIVLKAENLQRTGSFKLRGALAKLRGVDPAACSGVVTGSAGNHAQSLAYAARARGVRCRVYMPEAAAIGKVEAVRAFAGEVVLGGASVDDCVAAARQAAASEGLLFVHPFDDPDVIAGQAGVGLELAAQVAGLRRVVVPVGGGGLASGTAIALKAADPSIEVFGVQASGCAAVAESLARGAPVEVADAQTIADGIAVKRPGELTLPLLGRWLDGMLTVGDEAIVEAMVRLAERTKLVTEGAGAIGLAALLAGAVEPAPAGATAVVLSGGNVDPRLLAAAINRHEITASRRVRITTRVPDRPGGLSDLLAAIAAAGANILEVSHVRDIAELPLSETSVDLVLETRGPEHTAELRDALAAAGYEVGEG